MTGARHPEWIDGAWVPPVMGHSLQPRDAPDGPRPEAVEPEPDEEAHDDAGENEQRAARNPGADATDAERRQRPG
jgi:hypothetical protein